MSDHLTHTQIEDYGRHKLSAAELFSVSDHLDVCEACSRRFERELHGDFAFFRLQAELFGEEDMLFSPVGRAHLTPEQTAGYIDEVLTTEELQILKDHLIECKQCEMAVDDLRAFRERIVPSLHREYQPSTVSKESRWSCAVAVLLSLLPRPSAPVFNSALTGLLLILAVWLILYALPWKEAEYAETLQSQSTPAITPIDSHIPRLGDDQARMVARLNDGRGQVTLDNLGNLSGIENLSHAYQRMIVGALTNQRFEKSQLLAGLSQPAESRIRGRDSRDREFSIIRPVGTVSLTDRPTFRWSPLDGAASYVVEVYDDEYLLVANSSHLTENSWRPPKSLSRGKIYFWLVRALKDGMETISPRPPAPEAKFRILDQAGADELKLAERIYAGSHLMLGALYVRAGLLDEAELELRKLLEANPNSVLARKLLVDARAMR